MKAVLQRVKNASVKVDGETVGQCGEGLMILLGVANGDTEGMREAMRRSTARRALFDKPTK